MTEKGYNGWTNYETWLVKLWMDNDQGSYSYWQEAAQEAYDNPEENRYMELDRRRVHRLAGRLKDEHENDASNGWGGPTSCVYSDLLNAALSEVNWYEIAESLLEDVEKTDEEEEAEDEKTASAL